MRPKTTCSKAQMAQRLGVSPSRVSQLLKMGMPARPDGRLDIDRCTRWYAENIIRRPKLEPRSTQPTVAAVPGAPAGGSGDASAKREVIDALRRKATELPRLLAKLGCPVPAVLAAIDLADSFVWAAVGQAAMFTLYVSGDSQIAQPDYSELIGRPISAADIAAADEIVETVDRFFGFER